MKFLSPIVLLLLFFVTAHAQNETEEGEKVFKPVETSAAYPGGEKAWQRFLQNNLDTTVAAKNGAPIGKHTVIIQFIVDTFGQVSDVKPLTSLGYGMENEAMRILKKGAAWSPAGHQKGGWIPATQNGRMVKAYRKQSFTFLVEDPAVTITTKFPYTLFTNIDNPVFISVRNVKPESLRLVLQGGMITKVSDNNYLIRTDKPGELSLQLFKGKRSKQVAEIHFEVLNGPIVE